MLGDDQVQMASREQAFVRRNPHFSFASTSSLASEFRLAWVFILLVILYPSFLNSFLLLDVDTLSFPAHLYILIFRCILPE